MQDISLLTYAGSALRIGLLVLVGIPLLNWGKRKLFHICSQHFSKRMGILVGRILFYTGLLFIGVTILQEFGFNVTAFLGAAGIFGVVIGFASQTSVSNIVSGFFLLLEGPFSIGDTIKSGDVIGIVESIGLLSMSVRTLDSKLVRLPNEMVLKNSLVNMTYYPIKRMDFTLSASYTDDIEQLKSEMYDVIHHNKLFLKEPSPVIAVQKLGQHDYGTEIRIFLTIRVWVATEDFRSAPTILIQQLKNQFDKNKRIITILHTNPN